MPALIARKRDGGGFATTRSRAFIAGVTDGEHPRLPAGGAADGDRTSAASTARELGDLDRGDARTRATCSTLPACPGRKVDKHSTGGVGDKISLRAGAAGARAAACCVPMMSGRGARPHRRHARQAGGDPRLPRRRSTPAEFRRVLARAGLRAHRPDRAARARRPAALRAARRHRDGRVDPAHRVVDHVEEARRGHRRRWCWT